jgi:hypothetical protein
MFSEGAASFGSKGAGFDSAFQVPDLLRVAHVSVLHVGLRRSAYSRSNPNLFNNFPLRSNDGE